MRVIRVIRDGAGREYRLVLRLGVGAYGETFGAIKPPDEAWAVKELFPRPDAAPRQAWAAEVARFITASRDPYDQNIARDHVVLLADAFEFDGVYYIAMEWCDGSLRQLVECDRHYGPKWILPVANHVLVAMEDLHGLGVVHNDLHLGNVLYKREGPPDNPASYDFKLSDFGLQRWWDRGEGRPEEELLVGEVVSAARLLLAVGSGWEVPPEREKRAAAELGPVGAAIDSAIRGGFRGEQAAWEFLVALRRAAGQ